MNRPEVATNGALMTRLAREHGELEKIARPYREYRQVSAQLNETLQILEEGGDEDLRQLAEAERPSLEQRRERLLDALKEKLVTGDEASVRSIILEVRAGTGGEEAALFAGDLLSMYTACAGRKGFKVEPLSVSDSEMGGIREAILQYHRRGGVPQFSLRSGRASRSARAEN